MSLAIVIVSWNTADLLMQCLDSIYSSLPSGGSEVWVVDNASRDGSPGALRTRFPQVRLTENPENVGFARANNQAIRQSKGEYVLLLNPDTIVRHGALSALVAFMDSHPDAGAAGAQLLSSDGSLQPSCFPAPTLSCELLRLFHLDWAWPVSRYPMNRWDLNMARPVEVIQGACLILRRSALDEIGLLDEAYHMYTEEVDLCLRLRRAGWSLYWVPQAAVVHLGGQSTQQVQAEMFLHLYRSKILFFRKHYGWATTVLYKGILLAAALGRLVVSPLAWLARPSRRTSLAALADNYRRLVAALPGL